MAYTITYDGDDTAALEDYVRTTARLSLEGSATGSHGGWAVRITNKDGEEFDATLKGADDYGVSFIRDDDEDHNEETMAPERLGYWELAGFYVY